MLKKATQTNKGHYSRIHMTNALRRLYCWSEGTDICAKIHHIEGKNNLMIQQDSQGQTNLERIKGHMIINVKVLPFHILPAGQENGMRRNEQAVYRIILHKA